MCYALDDKADLEDIRRRQEGNAGPTLDELIRAIPPQWRLDRLCENDQGRGFAMLVHRTEVEHLLHRSVATEAPTMAHALAAVISSANR